MNRFSLNRIALEALGQVNTSDKIAQRNAALNLTHHLRTHGLSATVGYGLSSDENTKRITKAFVGALHNACPIEGDNITAQADTLKNQVISTYLLHSRLALPLADGFALAARALWPTETMHNKRPPMPNPSTHSPSHFRHTLPTATAGSNAMHRLLHTYPAAQASSEYSATHFSDVCNTGQAGAGLYPKAYERWKQLWQTAEKTGTASQRELTFMHRALINLAQPSLWEGSTSFNPTYGTSVIPGSACKGLARHFAVSHLDIAKDHIDGLFESTNPHQKVQFMDAWWVPGSAPGTIKDRPWVREIVTPHHPDFMNTQGTKPATPFDSPKPSPQIAIHGKFLFVVQGPKLWADYALNILQVALETEGIGARTPEYGCTQMPSK